MSLESSTLLPWADSPSIAPSLCKRTQEGHHVDTRAVDLPRLPLARFARDERSGRLYAYACCFTKDGGPFTLQASDDQGRTWVPVNAPGARQKLEPTDSGVFLVTRSGALVAAFSNKLEQHWTWDRTLRDAPDASIPLYVARSEDGGDTWSVQQLFKGWSGSSRDILQTRGGRIIFSATQLQHHPGHHADVTYGSDDDGRSWRVSNCLDFGGCGDHDGMTEATLLERSDGTLLKYIRTPWGRFWRAVSSDEGRTWHPLGPAPLATSHAPAILLRLRSGRVAAVWNPPHPAGERNWSLRGGDGQWTATPSSPYRGQLCLSFSSDDAQSWSAPQVVAQASTPGGEISYPYLFEPFPGELWLVAMRGVLKLRLLEENWV
jgi:hypothetical protein